MDKEESTLQEIYDAGEIIIADIDTNGVTLTNHRQLIQQLKRLIRAIGKTRKAIKDQRWDLKAKEMSDVKKMMEEQNMKKTPAREEVSELSRPARYTLEKAEIDIETMQDLVQAWNKNIRINEVDINKVWIWVDQI